MCSTCSLEGVQEQLLPPSPFWLTRTLSIRLAVAPALVLSISYMDAHV